MAGERRRYVVGAWKIPFERRDLAHEVITPDDDRSFFNIIRGGDDDPTDIGKRATYRVELTDEEAARFRAASNARYVELDRVDGADDYDAFPIPQPDVIEYMGADGHQDTWHGRDVLIACADDGTTAAARSYMGLNLVGRQVFADVDPGSGTNGDHGCKVMADLVPPAGQFLDVIIANPEGATRSNAVAGWAWAADQGAKVINYSYSGDPGSETSVYEDGVRYLAERGVVIFCSTGNDGVYGFGTPANYSRIYPNVISVGSFNHTTDERAASSNHHPRVSGVAPGDFPVWGLTTDGEPVEWSGTSAATPHAAQLCAMGLTGGHFTPMQVATALKRYTRDTGEPDSDQGGGAFDFGLAITELTKTAAVTDPTVTSRAWKVVSGPAQVGETLSTSINLNWTPPTAGTYVLGFESTKDGVGTTTDEVTVTVAGEGLRLPANPAEALWIGEEAGKNHFNLGIGQDGEGPDGDWEDDVDHLDYDVDVLEAGFTDPGHWDLTEDGDVYHRVRADAGRTSEGTDHPRTELRELNENGSNAAWNGATNKHHMWGRSRITDVTTQRPWDCFFQIHDASSDLIRVQCEGTTGQTTGLDIRARWTPPGGSDQSVTLPGWDNAYDVGDWIDWEIMIGGDTSADDGRCRVWLNGVLVFDEEDMGTTGCYFKAGNYLQSNVDIRGEEPDDTSEVVIAKGSFGHWHTGWAANTEPVFTGDLIGETQRFYLTNTASQHVPGGVLSSWWEAAFEPGFQQPRVLGNHPAGALSASAASEDLGSGDPDVMLMQFVSGPASAAGSIGGAYQLVVGRQQDDAAGDLRTSLAIWVTQGDDLALRGQVRTGFGDVPFTVADPRAASFSSDAIPTVDFQAGDRLILEVGYYANNEVTSPTYTGRIYFGGTTPPDLAAGDEGLAAMEHPAWLDIAVTPGVTFDSQEDGGGLARTRGFLALL